jgi:hypothetical protein
MIITRMIAGAGGGGQYAHLGTNFRTCSMVLPAQSGDLYIRDIRNCTVHEAGAHIHRHTWPRIYTIPDAKE